MVRGSFGPSPLLSRGFAALQSARCGRTGDSAAGYFISYSDFRGSY